VGQELRLFLFNFVENPIAEFCFVDRIFARSKSYYAARICAVIRLTDPTGSIVGRAASASAALVSSGIELRWAQPVSKAITSATMINE
jgi:hypothetical protein